jgi:hypothetical protein
MRFLPIIIALVLVSCSTGKPKESKPQGIIESKDMTELLVDLQQIEGANNLKLFQGDTGQINYALLYETIFEKHGTSKAEFDSSMAWYTIHPEEMEVIYDSVIEELMKVEAAETNQK